MHVWTILGALAVSIAALLLLGTFLGAWRRYRGVRVITCPENREPAAVRIAAVDAATSIALSGESDLHLRSCSRWPEMAGCDEACRNQIEDSPQACRLETIVGSWYEGKDCHYCAKEIGEIVWHERPPAVTLADGTIHEWKDLAAERLPKIFAEGNPVCWTCFMVENFRKEHPDLIVQRKRIEAPRHTLAPSTTTY